MDPSANPTDKDASDKLYTDSYFKLLNCKKTSDSDGAIEQLRILLQHLNFHASAQNLTDRERDKLKCELLSEHSELSEKQDSEQDPDLLPVVNTLKTNASSHISNDFTVQFNLQRFRSECSRIYKKLFPLEAEAKSFPNEAKTQKNCKSDISSYFSKPNQLQNQQKPCFQNKRMADCSEASNVASRLNKTAKISYEPPVKPNPAPQIASRCLSKLNCPSKTAARKIVLSESVPKPSYSGFMSANSMYKNPMKKENNIASNNGGETDESSSCDIAKHDTLKNFDKKITSIILNEIMDFSPNIKWTDIAGLEFVKKTVQEIVIWPLLRPDIFTGLRAPPRGILLFGPPGTGKTLIGKCIATESNSTFFCISASSLASKWVGESEQLVRALFAVARLQQPSVIFIDEIDSLLSQRSDKDQDFTRKLKTEFLVQFDGAKTDTEERVLVVGATNRPHELDEAARRRFVKRLFVPLPERLARRQIVEKLLGSHRHSLSEANLEEICELTEGYSGSDVAHLCKEAAMGPIRCIGPESIRTVSLDQVRPIGLGDFVDAMKQVRASVVQEDLEYYLEWNKKFGSFGV